MQTIGSWLRGKAGAWLAKKAVGRIAAPVGAMTVAALWAADPVSWRRVLIAVAAGTIVPLASFVPIRAIVARRSNGCNAALLLSLVVLDAFCTAWAVEWSVESWMSAFVAIVLVAAGVFYDVWIMSFALKLEEE